MTADTAVPRRKLIEVALPLTTINAALKAEKDRKVGKPQNNHHWWSRKPITAARVILFSQLVDDPSAHPEKFPTELDVLAERRRLHQIVEKLSEWESYRDIDLLKAAREEILASSNGEVPTIIDPFSGGGSIPLEAQRLGLHTEASDINPVAVLISKALIEIPPKFRNQPPVFPGAKESQITPWYNSTGLAEDVRRYGEWMRSAAQTEIGHLYPSINLPSGDAAFPIAWIWVRTVQCPNPGCAINMPLASKWWLSKKKGKEAFVKPTVIDRSVTYKVVRHSDGVPLSVPSGTVTRAGATCIGCGAPVKFDYIREEGRAGRIGSDLIAVVCEGNRTRIYLDAPEEHEHYADIDRPTDAPDGPLFNNPRNFNTIIYGLTEFSDLFTARQLRTLTLFSDLVSEARKMIHADARESGMDEGTPLADGGVGAQAYADAVSVFLGLCVSRLSDWNSNICAWEPNGQVSQHVFVQQSIGMTWDYSEANPLGIKSSGSFDACVRSVASSLEKMTGTTPGSVSQVSATRQNYSNKIISTDPPYFMQIGYSDLSDFFYVWLRRAIRSIYPELFSTVLVPKSDELVANEYRHGGKSAASEFFEAGFLEVFQKIRSDSNPDYPVTVYYASKESGARSGWETILASLISAGWSIVATWPIHEGMESRRVGQGTNALGSSVVMVLRPRSPEAPVTDRRNFARELKDQLPRMLRELQESSIAPVDFQQAAIGPGMSIFSNYSSVLDDDGTPMSIRSALDRINSVIDELGLEQEDDFDSITRFAITWFRQYAFDFGPYSEADKCARARNASLDQLERSGILTKKAGKVGLLSPTTLGEIPGLKDYNPATDPHISVWEVVMHMVNILTKKGVPAAAKLLTNVPGPIDRDLCKELSFLLFNIAEEMKRTQIAVEFNSLGTAWNDIVAEARNTSTQLMLDT